MRRLLPFCVSLLTLPVFAQTESDQNTEELVSKIIDMGSAFRCAHIASYAFMRDEEKKLIEVAVHIGRIAFDEYNRIEPRLVILNEKSPYYAVYLGSDVSADFALGIISSKISSEVGEKIESMVPDSAKSTIEGQVESFTRMAEKLYQEENCRFMTR